MLIDHSTKHPTPHSVADEFAAQTREAERTFVASLWLNPVEGHDAAVIAKLSGADFFDPRKRWLFQHLCKCAEQGVVPEVGDAVRLGNAEGLDFHEPELCALILDTPTHHRLPAIYAETVKTYARKRRIASKHLKIIGRILDPQGLSNVRTEQTGYNVSGIRQRFGRNARADSVDVAERDTGRVGDNDLGARRVGQVSDDDGLRRKDEPRKSVA